MTDGNTVHKRTDERPLDGAVSHNSVQEIPEWRRYINGILGAEISAFSRYYDRVIQWRPRPQDQGLLLEGIDCREKISAHEESSLPNLRQDLNQRSIILLNGNINHDLDIQSTLTMLKSRMSRSDRIVLVAYNPYFRWLYSLANSWGIRHGEEPCTFVTETDLANIAKLAGFEVVQSRPAVYCPVHAGGVGNFVNKVVPAIPGLRAFSLAAVVVLRPLVELSSKPSLSIVIPARNERGNIENALKRMPAFGGADIEVIYVEGHSKDQTWEEIQRVLPLYSHKYSLSAFQQTGKGKNDAVRLGFSKATKDILVILDADLTMPPELLELFYNSYCSGLADFINGNRLVYPMEGEAMKFLNKLGNVFFAKALSAVLGTRLGDSLCGTKLVSRRDYARFTAWRNDFGDFDPFGDFELLFPAAILGLGIVDIPIRYRDRTYGSTNIRRFYHGWMLLKMTLIGFLRVRLGRTSNPAR